MRRGDIGARLIDDGLLCRDLRIDVADVGFRRGDIGFGLVHRRLVVAGVDAQKELAGLDHLVVGDEELADIAGDLWRDDRVVGLRVGVIRRFEPAQLGEPVPGEDNRRDQQQRAANRRDDQPPAPPSLPRFGVIFGLPLRLRRGFGPVGFARFLTRRRDPPRFRARPLGPVRRRRLALVQPCRIGRLALGRRPDRRISPAAANIVGHLRRSLLVGRSFFGNGGAGGKVPAALPRRPADPGLGKARHAGMTGHGGLEKAQRQGRA